jgi:putative flippase GtrA
MPTKKGRSGLMPDESPRGRGLALLQITLSWARQLHVYTLVGGLVFLIDLTAYWAFMHYLGSWFLYAHFVSRSIGGVSCFVLNRYVTFRGGEERGLIADLIRFSILYAASFVLSSLLVYLYVSAAHVAPVPGKVIAECTVFLFNYTVMKYWVMKPDLNGQ